MQVPLVAIEAVVRTWLTAIHVPAHQAGLEFTAVLISTSARATHVLMESAAMLTTSTSVPVTPGGLALTAKQVCDLARFALVLMSTHFYISLLGQT